MSSSGRKGGRGISITPANYWRLMQSVLDDSEPALQALGLSPKGYFLLETVADHPFPAELARRMHVPPPTVTYLVKQLESRGLLERRPEAGDLRKFRLVLTPAGGEALRSGGAALSAAFNERLRRLSRDELAVFESLVARLAARDEGA
ncbi:MarR family winged helix-turn-helix transcriptional regulator [Aquisphaera insulae]|uniref:MarR family winged helix-turn-helix transcriptional regulator n=1 Tax=Aquisphaera insulae TaxID=2712864 RepID=UPI0013EDF407|nr:MarR family transcriptional regulator [Aquisphaera insulae]